MIEKAQEKMKSHIYAIYGGGCEFDIVGLGIDRENVEEYYVKYRLLFVKYKGAKEFVVYEPDLSFGDTIWPDDLEEWD